MADDMAPAEIGRSFAALTKQIDRVLASLEQMRTDSQLQFAALDGKFVRKDAMEAEVRLLNERQSNYEHQSDVATAAFENELVTIRLQFESAAAERRSSRQMIYGTMLTAVLATLTGVILVVLQSQ